MANTTVCPGATDWDFGPRVDPCIRQFDFTQLFEDSILSILPSGLFIVLSCLRIAQLSRVSIKVSSNPLHLVKLLAIAVLESLNLAFLAVRASNHHRRTPVSLAADTLRFVDILLLGLLSHLEYVKTVRPSLLLVTYLTTTVILDAARLRTLWLEFGTTATSILFTISLGVEISVLTGEALKKRRHLVPDEKDASSEETSGLYDLGFFLWPLDLIKTGFKNVLLLDDLSTIDRSLAPGHARERFLTVWNSGSFDQQKKHALAWATFRAFEWEVFAPVVPRLFLIGFTYSQPMLLNNVISYIQNDGSAKNNGASVGYGLIGAYFLVYVGFALSTGQYWHLTDRFITLTRGNLVATIYDKSLVLGIDSHQDFSVMTLMSTDVERIVNGAKNMHESWASLIELAIGLYLLQTQIGLACFTPLLLAIVITITVAKTGPLSSKYQKIWLESNQERIDHTTNMLSSMKTIRMRGITQKVHSIIQNLRISELKKAGGFRAMMIVGVGQSYSLSTLAPVFAFLVYSVYGQSHNVRFDPAKLFTTLSLVQLSTRPAITTLTSIPSMISALTCFSRIQALLVCEEPFAFRSESGSNHPQDNMKPGKPPPSVILPHNDIEVAKNTEKHIEQNTTAVTPPRAISVKDGSFGWKKHDKPILEQINLEINPGDVVMIVGPVGSGKSTLLQGLLGETSLVDGQVVLQPSKAAYTAQASWVRNGTIRDNIVGFLDFDQDWYNTVVRVCALQRDFDNLPQGDRTEVGSKGTSLSGGQRQRLTIARSVYTRAKIFLFDDIFSSLDKATTDSVFNQLSGPQGILRRLQATAVYVTHAVHLLPQADYVIALGGNSSIAEQGSFSSLIEQQGYVYNIYSESQSISPAEAVKDDDEICESVAGNTIEALKADVMSTKTSTISKGHAYRFYMKSFGVLNTMFFFLLMLACAFALNFGTVWLGIWSQASPERIRHHWGFYLAVYAGVQVAALLVVFYSCWFYFMGMVAKSGEDLHLSMLQTLGRVSFSFLSNTDTGTTTTRFSQDIMIIDTELPFAFLDASINVLDCAAILIIIAVSSPYIAISYPFLFVIFWALQSVYLRTSSQIRLLELAAKGPLFTQFSETVDGLATIRALGWQHELKKQQYQLIENSQKPFYLLLTIQRWLNLVLDLLVAGMAVLLVVLAICLKNVSAGFSGVALINIISLSSSISSVITAWTKLETSLGAIFRIVEFCTETPSELGDLQVENAPESWPSKGAIKFENVTAGYSADADSVLHSISFSVNSGEKIGIYGRTGSGKSSLLNVLFRMIDLTDGLISIDGADLAHLPKHQIRSRLICVPQDLYIIPGDIRANLDVECNCSDTEIIEALETVHLWDIIRDRGGLTAEMKSDLLSPGQTQLFSLSRALLHRSMILILDEATSSVDIRTEKLMYEVIRERFSKHTVISIAHRVAAAKDFDRIVVLDGGKLIGFGPYAEISRLLPTESG